VINGAPSKRRSCSTGRNIPRDKHCPYKNRYERGTIHFATLSLISALINQRPAQRALYRSSRLSVSLFPIYLVCPTIPEYPCRSFPSSMRTFSARRRERSDKKPRRYKYLADARDVTEVSHAGRMHVARYRERYCSLAGCICRDACAG